MGAEDRDADVSSVVLKAIGALVAIGLVVALGTFLFVKALGLDDAGTTTTVAGAAAPQPATPLPSTALSVPTPSDDSAPDEEVTESPTPRNRGGLVLNVSPVFAAPMERINLTGTYPGHDAMSLQVQRRENGSWADFPSQASPIQASVRNGTFETYVKTSQLGDNAFRVYDPQEDRGSNAVRVRID